MHKLYEYICDELKDLERKASNGELTMQELQYGDTLAHFKKNLLSADMMMEEDDEYSHNYYPMTSYADGRQNGGRGGRRNSYTRGTQRGDRYRRNGYSMDGDTIAELHELMEETPNETVKREIHKLIEKIERM